MSEVFNCNYLSQVDDDIFIKIHDVQKINDDKYMIIMDRGIKIDKNNKEQMKKVKEFIPKLFYKLYELGISHNDIHFGNLIEVNDEIKIIDYDSLKFDVSSYDFHNIVFLYLFALDQEFHNELYPGPFRWFQVVDSKINEIKERVLAKYGDDEFIQRLFSDDPYSELIKGKKSLRICSSSKSSEDALKLLNYTKTRNVLYNGKEYGIGYHSVKLDNVYHKGQRDCLARIDIMEKFFDFSNKNILDIGCCSGGMLHPLARKIHNGVGVDIDPKVINAANYIKSYERNNNLDFYTFNVDKDDFSLLNVFIQNVDVTFLFAVCYWVKKWRELIKYISENSKVLFIETNGSDEQQEEQYRCCAQYYKKFLKMYHNSPDDKGGRRFYIFSNE